MLIFIMSNTENKDEIIKFMYFSETGECGNNADIHEKYCSEMVEKGYRLTGITKNKLKNKKLKQIFIFFYI